MNSSAPAAGSGVTGSGEPKRLKPTPDTLRELFALSGNLCAFAGCTHILIDAMGSFVGQIAHIEGVKGERFNAEMSNEERRAPSNLILLCYGHHVETNDESVWTVEKMSEMKARHEERFRRPEIVILNGLRDWSQATELRLPRNLDRLARVLDIPVGAEQWEALVPYLERYRKVPMHTRKFLGEVVERMVLLDPDGMVDYSGNYASIPFEDTMLAFNCSPEAMHGYCDALDVHNLGSADEGFDRPEIRIRDAGGFAFWVNVAMFAREEKHAFSLYYLDLDFSRLED